MRVKVPSEFILLPEMLAYLLRFRPKDDKSKHLSLAGFTLDNSALLESAIRVAAASDEAELDRTNEVGGVL